MSLSYWTKDARNEEELDGPTGPLVWSSRNGIEFPIDVKMTRRWDALFCSGNFSHQGMTRPDGGDERRSTSGSMDEWVGGVPVAIASQSVARLRDHPFIRVATVFTFISIHPSINHLHTDRAGSKNDISSVIHTVPCIGLGILNNLGHARFIHCIRLSIAA